MIRLAELYNAMEESNKNKTGNKFSFALVSKLGQLILLFMFPILASAQDTTKRRQDSVDHKLSDRVFAQQDSAQQRIFYDSLQKNQDSAATHFYAFFKKFREELKQRNIAEYREDTISTKQEQIIKEIRRLTLEADAYLNSGIDTSGLGRELDKIERWFHLASEGVFINTGTIQTHRNLGTTFQVMRELLTRTLARKESLDNYYQNLVLYRNQIDSLYQASTLYEISFDSVAAMRYINKLVVVADEIKPIDSAIKKTIVSISELQTTVNRYVNILNNSLDKIGVFQSELSGKTFSRETSNLGGRVRSFRPFKEIVEFSLVKSGLAFVFYVQNEIGRFLLLLGIFCITVIFLNSLKKDIYLKAILTREEETPPVLKYPALSALVIILNIFQFIFPDPPFILIAAIWTVSAIALTIILRANISKYWMKAWLIMFVLFLLACAVNLVLQASRPERWIMLALSLAGVIAGTLIIFWGSHHDLKEKMIIYFIAFVVLLQLISVIANFYGRYNLSKTCLTSGFFNIVVAVMFFWTIRLINEGMALASKAYKVPGKKLFRINFDKVGSKAPTIFYVLLVFGWFVLFARNFYAHKIIWAPIKNFIYKTRTIGEFSYTIESVLTFFLILYLTGVISRLVSFFGSGNNEVDEIGERKTGLGSWVLMVRISIVLIGFLLALAAIGLPMDRLTIVLSALGVGVGFGLQTIVNNLVSGLIISFERPIKIGDFVEIGGQSGTIKSIGFRSSIITTAAGADVVIPNGDLLNRQLVNWTKENDSRGFDFVVNIAHATNVKKAMEILKALPSKDERVLSHPEPSVIIKNFTEQAIELQLTFWVRNIRQLGNVKTDLILAMEAAFMENGIKMPVPRQEVNIRNPET